MGQFARFNGLLPARNAHTSLKVWLNPRQGARTEPGTKVKLKTEDMQVRCGWQTLVDNP
jgi:hypothetical protein